RLPAESVIAGMQAALQAGVFDPAVVATEARRHADARPPAEVIPIGALARYDRPAPSVTVYDQLLTGETR
ncbi:MAG TPA: IS21 family transposase, partial [Acidimicrobiia bacterium]|nr:IS21 family transposase [Acidimicrobiia bacterium]